MISANYTYKSDPNFMHFKGDDVVHNDQCIYILCGVLCFVYICCLFCTVAVYEVLGGQEC